MRNMIFDLVLQELMYSGDHLSEEIRTSLDKVVYALCAYVRDSVLLRTVFLQMAKKVCDLKNPSPTAESPSNQNDRLLRDATLIHEELLKAVDFFFGSHKWRRTSSSGKRNVSMRFTDKDVATHPYLRIEAEVRFGIFGGKVVHQENCLGMNVVIERKVDEGVSSDFAFSLRFDQQRISLKMYDNLTGAYRELGFVNTSQPAGFAMPAIRLRKN